MQCYGYKFLLLNTTSTHKLMYSIMKYLLTKLSQMIGILTGRCRLLNQIFKIGVILDQSGKENERNILFALEHFRRLRSE